LTRQVHDGAFQARHFTLQTVDGIRRSFAVHITADIGTQVPGNNEEPCAERAFATETLLCDGVIGREKNILSDFFGGAIWERRQTLGAKAHDAVPISPIERVKIGLMIDVRPVHV